MSWDQLTIRFVALAFVFYAGLFSVVQNVVNPAVADQDGLHSPDELLLHYQELPNLSGGADGSVSIRIYQNGYTHVFYPKYMQQAGNYDAYLNDAALQRIWDLLTDSNVLAFNAEQVRNEILLERKIQKQSLLTLSSVSDTTEIRLEIFPNRYQSIGFGNGDRNEFKRIVWTGLNWDTKQFPQNDMLQSLKTFQTLLLSVTTQSNLTRID